MAPKRKGTCTYCGEEARVTKDHVPPKGLFPKDKRQNLVTVPCCEDCRLPTGSDDEYVKIVLSFRLEVGPGELGDQLRTSALRALLRPEQRGLRDGILTHLRPVDAFSPGGVYLGTRAAYPVDLKRLDRVFGRTVRGLYRTCTGRILPPDAHVTAFPSEYLPLNTPEARKHWLEHTEAQLVACQDHIVGNGVFTYKHTPLPHDQYSTWLLRFYGSIDFIAVTAPPGALDELSQLEG